MRRLFLLFCFFARVAAFAQTGTLPVLLRYEALQDSNYSFNNVLTNKNLPFTNGSIRPCASSYYWLKIIVNNPGHNSGAYCLYINPSINNTVYYFDANAQQWLNNSNGLEVTPRHYQDDAFAIPLVLTAQGTAIIYVHMYAPAGIVIKKMRLQTQASVQSHLLLVWDCWVASMAVLLFFILYNIYMYISFKDTSVRYYLIAQAGAIIYVTGFWRFTHVFMHPIVFKVVISPAGGMRYYNLDNLIEHAGITILIFGFVQLTRSYLNTKKHLPRLNMILKTGLYFYILASVVLIIINACFFYVESYTIIADNIYLMLLVLVIIFTAVAGYKLKLRAAGAFLLANILPLAFTIAIILFNLFISLDAADDPWLPALAVFSQAFIFSVAMVSRTRLIQAELTGKELEAQQLTFDLREIALKHSVVELENEKITAGITYEKNRNELLVQKLEANQRELASTTLYMVQKNKMLANLKEQIIELKKEQGSKKANLAGIESILQSNFFLDEDWNKFKLHFEQVHPDFFENLTAKHPSLTKNEVRLYAYFHMNLSPKEIASLLNIEADSVRRAKSRLLKKMGEPEE